MIITDLCYWEIIEDDSIIGGDNGLYDYLKVNYQQVSVTQLGLASAQALSLLGDAKGLATAVNIPNITQKIS